MADQSPKFRHSKPALVAFRTGERVTLDYLNAAERVYFCVPRTQKCAVRSETPHGKGRAVRGYYVRQIKKKYPVEVVECADEATPDKASETEELQIKDKEGRKLLQKIKEEDYVIALCIDGVHNSSLRWRERMQKRARLVSGSMVFVIGGSLGLSDAVVRRAMRNLVFLP